MLGISLEHLQECFRKSFWNASLNFCWNSSKDTSEILAKIFSGISSKIPEILPRFAREIFKDAIKNFSTKPQEFFQRFLRDFFKWFIQLLLKNSYKYTSKKSLKKYAKNFTKYNCQDSFRNSLTVSPGIQILSRWKKFLQEFFQKLLQQIFWDCLIRESLQYFKYLWQFSQIFLQELLQLLLLMLPPSVTIWVLRSVSPKKSSGISSRSNF